MSIGSGTWTIRLAASAEYDFQIIIAWTLERFGARQASTYAATLSAAVYSLRAGPSVPGARERNDIAKGVFSLHVASTGRRGRHFVMFRVGRKGDERWIEVLRLLHDSMDLQQHFPMINEPAESR